LRCGICGNEIPDDELSALRISSTFDGAAFAGQTCHRCRWERGAPLHASVTVGDTKEQVDGTRWYVVDIPQPDVLLLRHVPGGEAESAHFNDGASLDANGTVRASGWYLEVRGTIVNRVPGPTRS
jgi:hypothetical protein